MKKIILNWLMLALFIIASGAVAAAKMGQLCDGYFKGFAAVLALALLTNNWPPAQRRTKRRMVLAV